MQSSYHGLDAVTLQLIHEEWKRLPRTSRTGGGPPLRGGTRDADPARLSPHELSPVIAVLPGLIRLVNECTDKPVDKLRPTIKRLILEQLFMDFGGDSIVDAHHMLQVRQYVELTIRVLIRVRELDRGHETWSDAPVTPQMFG